jgi:hypothetical protein
MSILVDGFVSTATGPFAAPMNTIPKAVFTQKGVSRNDNWPRNP